MSTFDAGSLEDRSWQLNQGVELPRGTIITARFGGGTMYGSAAGQRYRVDYRRDGDALRMGQPSIAGHATTPEGGRSSADFFARLGAVARHRVDDQALELQDERGSYVLRFVLTPDVPDTLSGRWEVRSVVQAGGSDDRGSAGHRGSATTPGDDRYLELDRAGRVTGSGGVNQFSGPARGDDARLTLGPLTLTRMGGAPDATDAETAFVSALESTASYRVEVDRLELLDADGQTLVRLARPGSA